MPRLKRVDVSTPGITRRRRGRGFQYLDESGRTIRNKEVVERINALAIPPAWEDVWICTFPFGHIQATGNDAAGRKQYRYHDHWRERRDREKFDSMIDFARSLPRLRRTASRDLARGDLSRERVLGGATRLLDRGFFRIGSEGYAEDNETYGLATIRKDHVTVRPDAVVFDYDAKGGQRRVQQLADPELLDLLGTLRRRRSGGPELLAYKQGRTWRDVRSQDINDYVKEAADGDFSAKDFRTWHATVFAAIAVEGERPKSKTARKRRVNEAVKGVAYILGNTPAVCRASYIDPRVFDRFDSGWTIKLSNRSGHALMTNEASRRRVEKAVIDLISEPRESPHVKRAIAA